MRGRRSACLWHAEECIPAFAPPDQTGVTQCLLYDTRNLATVAATGVWMHFHNKRILSHVRRVFSIDEDAYTVKPTA